MSERQLYRLRAPSSGREMLLAGRAGQGLPRPRDGRAARGRREGAAARPVEVQPAMGGRDAALLQLVRPARPEGPQRLPDVRPPDGRAAPLTSRPPPCACSAPRFSSPYSRSPSPPPAAAAASVAVQEVPGAAGRADRAARQGRRRPVRATPAPRRRRHARRRRRRPATPTPPPPATTGTHRHDRRHRHRHRAPTPTPRGPAAGLGAERPTSDRRPARRRSSSSSSAQQNPGAC